MRNHGAGILAAGIAAGLLLPAVSGGLRAQPTAVDELLREAGKTGVAVPVPEVGAPVAETPPAPKEVSPGDALRGVEVWGVHYRMDWPDVQRLGKGTRLRLEKSLMSGHPRTVRVVDPAKHGELIGYLERTAAAPLAALLTHTAPAEATVDAVEPPSKRYTSGRLFVSFRYPGLLEACRKSFAAPGARDVEVRGLGFHASSGTVQGIAVGASLILQREPENAHDPNAVRVLAPGTGAMIGYVDRAAAAVLAPVMDSGASPEAAAAKLEPPSWLFPAGRLYASISAK